MKGWLAFPALLVLGLVTLPASAAVRDVDGTAALTQTAAGQYKLTVANTGSTVIMSVVFTSGPALKVSAVTSSSTGTCTLSGTTGISCAVALAPPPCPCNPGDAVEVLFAGSGEPGGSSVSLDGAKTITLGAPPAVTPPPATAPPTGTGKVTKLSARVGPGAKIAFIRNVPAGKATITVRDMTAADNFHLVGAGVNKKTGVGFRGTVTWTVALKKGVYTFRSDAHAKLGGKTTVS
jgi:hypothetical protein